MMDLCDIHSELDHLSLRTLELTQELVEAKIRMENTTKEGYIMLAKSRYSMGGSNAVSRLQLPSSEVKEGDGEEDSNEFDANVTVRSDECLRTDSGVRFQYLSIEEKEKKEEEDTSTSLKHRLKKPSSGIEEIVSSHKGHDPLKWFGVLVPGTLRQSQSHFSRAVEQSVECANLHNEIQGVLARQKYLRRMKAKIEKEMQD